MRENWLKLKLHASLLFFVCQLKLLLLIYLITGFSGDELCQSSVHYSEQSPAAAIPAPADSG